LTDNNWMLPNQTQPPKAARSPGREPLFALTKRLSRLACSLLFHGEFGVEAQFFLDGELESARAFIMKELAVRWAEQERQSRKTDGWSDATPEGRHDGSDAR
jgi:hypothetical protein